MNKIMLMLSIFTVTCFSLSWAASSASGMKPEYDYPESVFKTYAAVKSPTGSVQSKKSVSTKGVEEIEIETTATDVTLERVESETAEITLNGRYPGESDPLLVNTEGSKLEVRVRETDTDNKFKFNITFDESEGGLLLRVPAGVRKITVKTVSGDVHAKKMQLKDLAVKSVSGDVNLDDAKLQELLFQSTSGDLNAEQLEAEKVSGKTISGDLSLTLHSLEPRMELNSTSGDIELRFRSEPNLKVDFKTVSGEVDADMGSKSISHSGSQEFTLGKETGLLQAKTISGDLSIRKF
jgi:DUF4097 and DUF4098 domain-containing protein YvlB